MNIKNTLRDSFKNLDVIYKLANWYLFLYKGGERNMALKAFAKKNEKNDILTLRKKLNCSQEKLARIIGIAGRTVSRWETNKSIPSALANIRIRELQRILDKMNGVIKEDKKGEWLNTPNEELNNDTPLEVISRGSEEAKEILELLHRIEWGIPA